MAFLSDEQLTASVAEALGLTDPALLPVQWADIIPKANHDAQADIIGTLVDGRGYSLTVAQTFDQSEAFNRAIGVYWALTFGGGLHNLPDATIKRFDRRGELKTVGVLVGGVVPVDPDTAGQSIHIGSGRLKTSGNIFGQSPGGIRTGPVTRPNKRW